MNLPILKFAPIFKTVLWGGQRIAAFKGLPVQGSHVGESWELSPMAGWESVALTPPFEDRTLPSLIEEYGREILGPRIFAETDAHFPLLVKFIDANDDLSIQVHPDACMAGRRHNCNGKNELWYSIAPLDGAYLYAGFNTGVDAALVRRKIEDKSLIGVLRKFYTQPGDVFYIPAGCVHSLGPGNLVLEIQEASDITYRVYDYDRCDADGRPRQLHIEESIEAMDYSDNNMALKRFEPVENEDVRIVESQHFTTTFLSVSAPLTVPLAGRDSFSIFVAVKGSAVLVDDLGRECELRQGDTALIPASVPAVRVLPRSAGTVGIVTAYR